jgi:hypothetical protein
VDFQRFLVSFKSYEGGNPFLSDLNKIRNGKIHRTLAPFIIASPSVGFNGNFSLNFDHFDVLSEWDAAKNELTYMRTRGALQGKLEVNVALNITLTDATPKAGIAALDFFRSSAREVARIIECIETETARVITSRP